MLLTGSTLIDASAFQVRESNLFSTTLDRYMFHVGDAI